MIFIRFCVQEGLPNDLLEFKIIKETVPDLSFFLVSIKQSSEGTQHMLRFWQYCHFPILLSIFSEYLDYYKCLTMTYYL